MSDTSFKLLIMGKLSSGKTSLVNALLGEKLLPEKALPCTAIITEVYYGKEKKVIMFPKPGKCKEGNEPFEIEPTLSEIEKYSTYSTINNNIGLYNMVDSFFEKMVIYWPNEMLKEGFSIIDSPGTKNQYDYTVESYLPKADAILYCIAGTRSYDTLDRNTLERITAKGYKDLIIVTTYSDYISNEEKNEYVEDTLKHYLRHTDKKYCHYVDSKLGFEAKQNGSHAELVESGYYELEKFLREYLYGKRMGYISHVIEYLPDMTAEKRAQYTKMLSAIDHRRKDPHLNVALIGDFSTGKSTFINALIKQNILKTAWRATTAVPTHIYYHSNNDINMLVDTVDGITYNMSFENDRLELEKFIGQKLSEDMKELITFLTTTNDFAEQIKLIKVLCPSDVMFKDICIIDTPGVNPGADDTKSHVMATRNVLREYADATIVLFSGLQVYTNSFNRFLEENAKHFMNEAVFVITMLDKVDESERTEVVEFARQSLMEAFNLENPLVFGCCAKYSNEPNVSSDKLHWCSEFENFRHDILMHINKRRQHIIKKQMSSFLLKLIEELNKDIQGNISRINYQIEVLNENSIENLKAELEHSRIIHEYQIQEAFTNIHFDDEYRKMFSNILCRAKDSINSCTKIRGSGRESISGYVSSYLPAVISGEQKKFSENINEPFASANKIVQKYFEKNKEIFKKYSINLKQSTDIVIAESFQEHDKNLGKVTYYDGGALQDVFEIAGTIVGFAVAAPTAIIDGFFGTDISDTIMSGVDTFIGGVVNFFGDLSAKKQDAISSVEKSINKMRDENQKEFSDQIEERKNGVITSIAEIEQKFADEYKAIYTERKNEFDLEKEKLEEEIDYNKSIQKKLNAYFNELESERI